MTTATELLDQVAERFIELDTAGQPMAPVADIAPTVSQEEAYQIQRLIIEKLVARGETVVGKKTGVMTAGAQESMGLTEPAYGHLLQSHAVADGSTVAASDFIRPVLECEVTFRMSQPLQGPGVTAKAVLAATESVVASFELVDFRSQTLKPTMAEVLGYNVFAKGFVLGQTPLAPSKIDLPSMVVVLKKNGEEVARGNSEAVMGDSAAAVAWLVNKMADHNLSLKAGELVLSGTLTPPQPVQAGDHFEAEFSTLGKVSVRFE